MKHLYLFTLLLVGCSAQVEQHAGCVGRYAVGGYGAPGTVAASAAAGFGTAAAFSAPDVTLEEATAVLAGACQ